MREKEPSVHYKTVRQAIFDELSGGMKTIRELSQALGISEKEVISHLGHVERSAGQRGCKFIMKPSECLRCGFVFERRERMKRPGRCPECRSELLSNPYFGLEKVKG
ncbi:MAG TPA: transcriptional regulator [Thermodesulfobacteriota bacterium]|nr:transcriptional regulator [Thermodesulfobacteriota bacterium]